MQEIQIDVNVIHLMVKWNTFLWILSANMCTRKGEIIPIQITNNFNEIVCETHSLLNYVKGVVDKDMC